MVSINSATSGGDSASPQGGSGGSEASGMYAREPENHNNMTNSGGGQDSSGKSDDESKRPPFSMHGVLHFLEHEWTRYEKERTQWEMERAELRARVSFLLGERKGQENLKRDLVRRIKMLEYSLKQERAKVYRLTHNGEDPEPDELDEQLRQELESMVPLDVDAVQQESGNPPAWKQARQMLTQYLQEIGYSEKILNNRSFRVKDLPNRLNNVAQEKALLDARSSKDAILESCDAILETAEHLRGGGLASRGSSSSRHVANYDSGSENEGERNEGNLDKDTAEALDEFAFLSDDKGSQEVRQAGTNRANPDRAETKFTSPKKEDMFNKMEDLYKEKKEKLKNEMQERKRGSTSGSLDAGVVDLGKKRAGPDALMDINAALGLAPDEGAVDINDDFAMTDDDTMTVRWGIRYSLRSHYDAVRAMQFHPVEPLLITASEDGTAKLWNLNAKVTADNAKATQTPRPASGVVDVEPIYTFRGHKGPIVSMDMNPTGDYLYTGGYDGSICCWRVPSRDIGIEDPYDSSLLVERLSGHTDIVWAVTFHSSTNRVISASADGTVRLWEPGDSGAGQSLLRTFTPPTPEGRPRSIDVVSTEPQQLLTAYSKGVAGILDLESGKTVLNFDLIEGKYGENAGEINKIISHPTLPVTILAGEDRRIRYFDNNTGKLIHGTVAHVEGVSTLAADTNGLYLLSGSHDGSLRLWNMETKICLQEIAAHHKKHEMSVLSVAFHPSRPLIGSAGADGLAKVYTSERSQYAGGSHFAE